MPQGRWWRPTLAFLITFGVLALAGSLVRVATVYRRAFAMGLQPDDTEAMQKLSREVARIDQSYTPAFLLTAFALSALMAAFFYWKRPRSKVDEPPPLPGGRG